VFLAGALISMLDLNQVTKRYGSFLALDEITARIEPGAVGLLGPNGAGKSTLIKMLLGLVRLTSGQARVLDMDVARSSLAIRQSVGYMPEDDCYFAGFKGVESVAYAGELAGMPGSTALRRAHEMLDYVTIGEERYREVQTYSTGMKQKIKLAQALIHSPQVVFLDEPTSGLDPQGRERMLQLIRSLAVEKGVSVVVSTHILKDVETCCDAVLMLAKGKLLVYDTLANLRRRSDESLSVQFSGDVERFRQALGSHGCESEPHGVDTLLVRSSRTGVSDLVFEAAVDSQTAIRQLSPARNSLEEIFIQRVNEAPHAHL